MKKNTARGFTLIELLVVIAIIGILSSVVLASLGTARTKSRDARRLADMRQLQVALELYYSSNDTYPTTGIGLAGLVPNAMGAVPTDPGSSSYVYRGINGGADCTTAPCPSYVVRATLEGTVPPGSAVGTIGGVACSATGAYCLRP